MSSRSLRTRRPTEKSLLQTQQQSNNSADGPESGSGHDGSDDQDVHTKQMTDTDTDEDGSVYEGDDGDLSPSPTKKQQRKKSGSAAPSASGSRASANLSGDVGLLAPDYTLNPAGPASSSEIDFRCPNCDKIYRGKHARSIWRRHLQDKHGIPLSMQPRRTRWDNDANRPRDADERRARTLDSKRRWARKARASKGPGSTTKRKSKQKSQDLSEDEEDFEDDEDDSGQGLEDQQDQDEEDFDDPEPPPRKPAPAKRTSSTRGRGRGRGRGRPPKTATAARASTSRIPASDAVEEGWEDAPTGTEDFDWTRDQVPAFQSQMRSPYRSSPIPPLPPRSRGAIYPPGHYDRASAMRATSSLEPEYSPHGVPYVHRDFRNLPPLPPTGPGNYQEQPHYAQQQQNYYDADLYHSGRYSAPPVGTDAYAIPPPIAASSLATVDGRASLSIGPSSGASSSYYSPRASHSQPPLASPVRLGHHAPHPTESKEDAAVVLLALKQASSAPPSPAGPPHLSSGVGATAPRARTYSHADQHGDDSPRQNNNANSSMRAGDTSFSSLDNLSSEEDRRRSSRAPAETTTTRASLARARAVAVPLSRTGSGATSRDSIKRGHSPPPREGVPIESPKKIRTATGTAVPATTASSSLLRSNGPLNKYTSLVATPTPAMRRAMESSPAARASGHQETLEGDLDDYDDEMHYGRPLSHHHHHHHAGASYSSTRDEGRPSSSSAAGPPSSSMPRSSHALSAAPSSSSVGLSSELGGFGLHSSSGGSGDDLSSSTGGAHHHDRSYGPPLSSRSAAGGLSSSTSGPRRPTSAADSSSSFLATPAPSDSRMSHVVDAMDTSGAPVFGSSAFGGGVGSSATHDHYYTHLASSNLPAHPFVNQFGSSNSTNVRTSDVDDRGSSPPLPPLGRNGADDDEEDIQDPSSSSNARQRANVQHDDDNEPASPPSRPSAALSGSNHHHSLFSSPAHPGVSKMLGLTAQPGPGVWVGDTPGRDSTEGDTAATRAAGAGTGGAAGGGGGAGATDWDDWGTEDSVSPDRALATTVNKDSKADAEDDVTKTPTNRAPIVQQTG